MDELFMFPLARFAFSAVLCAPEARAVNTRLKNQFVYIETHTARAVLCPGWIRSSPRKRNKKKMLREKCEMFRRRMPGCRYLRNRKAIWMMNTDSFGISHPAAWTHKMTEWHCRACDTWLQIKSMKLMISTCRCHQKKKRKTNENRVYVLP